MRLKVLPFSRCLGTANKMASTWTVEEFLNDDEENPRSKIVSNSHSRAAHLSHTKAPTSNSEPSRGTINAGKRSMKRAAQVEFFATCISGMEKVLLEEIKALTDVDPSSIRIGKSGVHYSGSMVAYYALFSLLLLLNSKYSITPVVDWNGQSAMATYFPSRDGANS